MKATDAATNKMSWGVIFLIWPALLGSWFKDQAEREGPNRLVETLRAAVCWPLAFTLAISTLFWLYGLMLLVTTEIPKWIARL